MENMEPSIRSQCSVTIVTAVVAHTFNLALPVVHIHPPTPACRVTALQGSSLNNVTVMNEGPDSYPSTGSF